MKYRVEMVCYVEVPAGTSVPKSSAFDLAYTQVVDDEPDELWICEGGSR